MRDRPEGFFLFTWFKYLIIQVIQIDSFGFFHMEHCNPVDLRCVSILTAIIPGNQKGCFIYLFPAADTEFAKDKTFSYSSSDLI